ncbi:butyrophilin subfamily 2 member A2-like isoform X1 [Anguilla rostrata]|uniref:butyrophilin subfamily 2 member A2-like isoform X1 n=1 Tax=Anguilla rostrata TaxID=7938 RepID=UPI0030D1E5F4
MMKIKMRVFCWFLSLFCAIRTEGFAVWGPAMPLVVQLGASVTLPCSVDTPLPLHELEVQWMREDSATLVHLFQEGESRPESQSPAYSGRADFFSEEISKGNFSLLLRSVTSEDKGLYKCVVHTVHESNETEVKIDIERLVVTGADVPVFAYADEDVILNCSVDTHVPLKELQVEWMKTDGEILVLLFFEGENRPESQHERFRGRAVFFTEEIPKGNFSLKLRNVKTEDKGEFMCKVHTDRESVIATVWLRELGFSSLHMWVLVLTIAAAVFAVLSCIPALRCIIEKGHYMSYSFRKDKSNRAMLLYCLQVSVPCILISIAFAIWGYIEGSVGEAFVGSAINFMRIQILFWVIPPKYIWEGTHWEIFTYMALPLENLVITTGVNSVVLQTFFIHRAPDSGAKALTGILFGIVLFLSFSSLAVHSVSKGRYKIVKPLPFWRK